MGTNGQATYGIFGAKTVEAQTGKRYAIEVRYKPCFFEKSLVSSYKPTRMDVGD